MFHKVLSKTKNTSTNTSAVLSGTVGGGGGGGNTTNTSTTTSVNVTSPSQYLELATLLVAKLADTNDNIDETLKELTTLFKTDTRTRRLVLQELQNSSHVAILTRLKNLPAGSVSLQLFFRMLQQMTYGNDLDPKAMRSALQKDAYPFVMPFIMSALVSEGNGSKVKFEALETARCLSRNYDNKFTMFQESGYVQQVLRTIKEDTLELQKAAIVLLTTLSSDEKASMGLVRFPDFLFNLLQLLNNADHCTVAVQVVQNMCQHVKVCDGIKADEKGQGKSIIDRLKDIVSKPELETMYKKDGVMQALMSLANIIGSDEGESKKFLAGNADLIEIAKLLEDVLDQNTKHWTLTTTLKPLLRLCVIDQNRELLAKQLLKLVPRAFEQSISAKDHVNVLLCVDIFCQLSFDKTNLEEMLKNPIIMKNMEKVRQMAVPTAENPMPSEDWIKAARHADVFRFNTHAQDSSRTVGAGGGGGGGGDDDTNANANSKHLSRKPSVSAIKTGPKVMISYQWNYQQIATNLEALLRKEGCDVWIDTKRMNADIMDAMANAVDTSDVVLMLISETYKSSAACKAEANYAFVRKKKQIPVIVQQNYFGDGWLGMMIANKMYYECYNQEMLQIYFPKLVDEVFGPIGRKGSMEVFNPESSSIPENGILNSGNVLGRRTTTTFGGKGALYVYPASIKTLSTIEDVVEWLELNDIKEFKNDLTHELKLDGAGIRGLFRNWKAYQDDLKHCLSLKHLKDRIRLFAAMENGKWKS
jgi:hypothetical protein